MAKAPRNLAASVRQRLLNLSREEGRVFDVVLVTYGLERLIYRLSVSDYQDRFILKGGMLVTLWISDDSRITRDADFLGTGDASEERLKSVFANILSLEADDGLVFDVDGLTAETIREEQEYGGIRLKTIAYLGKMRIPITVDIGFGDALTDRNYTIDYPSLLDMPLATVRAYPPATVVAEKFQAIVALGLVNSRMKDYYDLWAIHNSQRIKVKELDAAIQATFERRGTDIPREIPIGLSDDFVNDEQKIRQWRAYVASIDLKGLSLDTVVDAIWSYIAPACERLTSA
jgi:predicted nucleotidyltransferase component of viral defense system